MPIGNPVSNIKPLVSQCGRVKIEQCAKTDCVFDLLSVNLHGNYAIGRQGVHAVIFLCPLLRATARTGGFEAGTPFRKREC